jgi:SAM-dependent methyltransferase
MSYETCGEERKLTLFAGALAAVNAIAVRYEAAVVNEVIAPSGDNVDPTNAGELVHYLRHGREAIQLILQAMLVANKTCVKTILDMPCGFGRVARHLVAAFPEATLWVCDLYEDQIAFCAQQFGGNPLLSRVNISELSFPLQFDLIWCGSLLTHLPKRQFLDTLRLFSRSLAPDGIAVVTTHGRFSPWLHHTHYKYLSDDRFIIAEREFYKNGFGFVNYQDPVSIDSPSYGISLSSAAFVVNAMEEDDSIRIVSFTETGWDRHQDVLVFRKLPIFSYSAIQSWLDVCQNDLIAGWAWDVANPTRRLEIDIIVDGARLARVTAGVYRPDLEAAGVGDGTHAFYFTPPSSFDLRHHSVEVVVSGTDHRLPRGDRRRQENRENI